MPINPPSLGDEPEHLYKLIQETYDLPVGRKPLLVAIESILAGGGVQKLVIQLGQQIKVVRKIKDDGSDIDGELISDDLMDASRNALMEEFAAVRDTKKVMSSYELIFNALLYIGAKEVDGKKIKPRAVLVRQTKALKNWLDTQSLDTFFGTEIVQHEGIPDDAFLIVCSDVVDEESILFSLKVEMEQPWRKK